MAVDDFVAALCAHADRVGGSPLTPIIGRFRRPVRVRVQGRPGVGRRTVTSALRAAGVAVVDAAAEVDVQVIAETAKPEDLRTARALIILNKADLLGDAAAGRVRLVRRLTGTPTIAMSALLATAELDAPLLAALRVLAAVPADLTGTDAFCAGPHPVDPGTRSRLLATLDLAGIAALTAAIRSGGEMTAVLRRSSNIDQVLAGVQAAAAPVRYHRLHVAMTELRALAARTEDQRLAALLTGDSATLAAMSAATDVLRADGLDTDSADPLRCAARWQHYSRGPVNALHRRCGVDMARGALRLAAGQLP